MRVARIGGIAVALVLAIGCKDEDDDAASQTAEDDAAAEATPPPEPVEPDEPLPDLAEDPGQHAAAHAWSARFGAVQRDAARDLAFGPNGRLAMTGYFSGTVPFGDHELTAAGETDAFVAVFESDGTVAWARGIGGEHEDAGNAITFDADGNVYAVGQFGEKLTIGDNELASNGSDDVFVIAFAPDGEPRWGRAYGSYDSDEGNAVAADADGNVYVGGGFRQPVTVGEETLESVGGYDAFVIGLTDSGAPRWAERFGDEGDDTTRAMTVDPQGRLLAALEFAGTLKAPGAGSATTNGNTDLAVLKLDPAGTPIWVKGFGGGYSDIITGIAADGAGNIAVTGAFDREITVEGETLKGKGDTDIFVLALTPEGNRRWIRTFGAIGKDVGADVATDRFGNVTITGHFHDEVAFGDSKLASSGNRDAFLLKLGPGAELRWARRFGDRDHDQGSAVAVDDDGNVAFAGVFRFTVNFGGQDLDVAKAPEHAAPFGDIFVASYRRGAE